MFGLGCGIGSGALPRSIHPVGGSQGDFNFVEFVPLGVGPLPFRYGQKLLKTAPRRSWLLIVHGGIIPLFCKNPDDFSPHSNLLMIADEQQAM